MTTSTSLKRLSAAAYLVSGLLLSACGAAPTGVEVAPPIVITVVVTPTESGNETPAAAQTPTRGTPTPSAEPAQPASPYPAPFQNNVSAVYQDFENGFMIYLADRRVIWVFVRAVTEAGGGAVRTETFGQWLAFADTFEDGQPETDPAITPPEGFQQPKRGFGKVWRENPEVREALGWALDFERPYTALVIDYGLGALDEAGAFAPHTIVHLITTLDGSRVHIDEAAKLWSKP